MTPQQKQEREKSQDLVKMLLVTDPRKTLPATSEVEVEDATLILLWCHRTPLPSALRIAKMRPVRDGPVKWGSSASEVSNFPFI